MAPPAGTYELVSQDNYVAYLQSLGLSAADAEKSLKGDALVISPIESDKITLKFSNQVLKLTLNQELEYTPFEGVKIKALATVNGDVLTIKSKITEDLSQEQVFTPTDSGLVVVSTNTKGVKGERRYKRV